MCTCLCLDLVRWLVLLCDQLSVREFELDCEPTKGFRWTDLRELLRCQ